VGTYLAAISVPVTRRGGGQPADEVGPHRSTSGCRRDRRGAVCGARRARGNSVRSVAVAAVSPDRPYRAESARNAREGAPAKKRGGGSQLISDSYPINTANRLGASVDMANSQGATRYADRANQTLPCTAIPSTSRGRERIGADQRRSKV